MKLIFSILLCLFMVSANGQTVTLDSGLQRYFVPIKDTILTPDRPAATRLYCFVTTDMLYGACSIYWQLSYNEENTTYTLTGGQVMMAGDDYLKYAADNRNIIHLFTYTALQVGVTFQP